MISPILIETVKQELYESRHAITPEHENEISSLKSSPNNHTSPLIISLIGYEPQVRDNIESSYNMIQSNLCPISLDNFLSAEVP